MIKVLDCTTRDGGHDNNWSFDNNFVEKHIITLQKNKINYYD